MKTVLLVLCILFSNIVQAQDPEFPKKEFIMHIRLHSGMITSFNASPELFTGGLQLIPQFTIAENKLRAGMIADVFYTGKKLQAAFGPTFSWKIKTLAANNLGSVGNLNISFDHLWGTGKQRLIGGGFQADIVNKIVAGISLHRDYKLKNWWLQSTVAFRISKVKKINPI